MYLFVYYHCHKFHYETWEGLWCLHMNNVQLLLLKTHVPPPPKKNQKKVLMLCVKCRIWLVDPKGRVLVFSSAPFLLQIQPKNPQGNKSQPKRTTINQIHIDCLDQSGYIYLVIVALVF